MKDSSAAARPKPQRTMPLVTKGQIQAGPDQIDSWYHVIDLGHGLRTPGAFEMGQYWDKYPWPDSFAGLRILDVGASNGFFSIEFAKRGAKEVIALDLPGWEHHD